MAESLIEQLREEGLLLNKLAWLCPNGGQDEAIAANLADVDPGIMQAVLTLRSGGVETIESCEGGDGHSFPEPTIRFNGDSWAGYRAFALAMEHGLKVASVRQVYDVIDGQLKGPWWEMTFRTIVREQKREVEYRSVQEQPVIKRGGNWSNHHFTEEGLIGGRVSRETATHIIRTTTEVFAIRDGKTIP